MRSDSPESEEDTPDNEGSKGGDENFTELESVRYAKVRRGERSKHNAGKGLVEKTGQETYPDKGTLSSCMNTTTDMEDDDSNTSELRGSDPSTDPVIEIRFAYDTIKGDYIKDDTSCYE